jgi:hypothetical protein
MRRAGLRVDPGPTCRCCSGAGRQGLRRSPGRPARCRKRKIVFRGVPVPLDCRRHPGEPKEPVIAACARCLAVATVLAPLLHRLRFGDCRLALRQCRRCCRDPNLRNGAARDVERKFSGVHDSFGESITILLAETLATAPSAQWSRLSLCTPGYKSSDAYLPVCLMGRAFLPQSVPVPDLLPCQTRPVA